MGDGFIWDVLPETKRPFGLTDIPPLPIKQWLGSLPDAPAQHQVTGRNHFSLPKKGCKLTYKSPDFFGSKKKKG